MSRAEVCHEHYQTKFTTREEAQAGAQGRAGARVYYGKECASWHVSTRGGQARAARRTRGGQR